MDPNNFKLGWKIGLSLLLLPMLFLAVFIFTRIDYALAGSRLAEDINNYYLEEMATKNCVHKFGPHMSPTVVTQLQEICESRGPVRDFSSVPWNETTPQLVGYVRRKTYKFRESYSRDQRFSQVESVVSVVEYSDLGHGKSVLQKQGKSGGL